MLSLDTRTIGSRLYVDADKPLNVNKILDLYVLLLVTLKSKFTLMRTKGFSIGIIFLVLLVCTSCTKDEAYLTPDGEFSALKV